MLTKPDRIDKALTSCGLNWSELSSRAQAIILFGSEAAKCSSKDSDVDLICIGTGERVKSKRLHLIWLKPDVVHSPSWLRTELGGHVAKYGVWLKGENKLGSAEPASTKALSKKMELIRQRAEVLAEYWSKVSVRFKTTQLRKLRRDVQRLSILRNGGVVPPTPILDLEWTNGRTTVWRSIRAALVGNQCLATLVASVISNDCGRDRKWRNL